MPSSLFPLRWMLALGFAIGLLVVIPAVASADTGDVGFEGPATAGGSPSGSKPESKLWFNDGFWWASMWDTATSDNYIWKLDQTTETWTRTNTRLDDRSSTRADVLWDGTKLYVASHQFSESDGSGTSRLYRFSYNSSTDTYTVDSGYPKTINSLKTETLVIAKDSTGKLWATWEQGGKIYINRTSGTGTSWGTAFQVPGSASVNADDISSIIAFGGNKIGVFWSNQVTQTDYFSVHTDGTTDNTGWVTETAYSGNLLADDHMNLKTDASGRVYSVVKTSLDAPPNSGGSPYIVLLVRQTNGTWSSNVVSTASQNQTRPILEIDETNALLRVFVTSNGTGGTINQHTSPINAISFPGGAGSVVMKDASAMDINNASSTKQNITAATGLVVLGSNDTTKRYWHADILNSPPPNTAPTANAASASTPSGTPVSVGLSGSDPETCDLNFSIVTPPAHGTLGSITPATCTAGSPNTDTASVTYSPTGPYTGPDSFTYKVNDGSLDSTPATATLSVTGTDVTPPTRTTSTVNGATLTVNYDEPLDTTSVPTSSAYASLVNGSARGISNVAVSGSAVTLTLASPVISTDVVTLSYTAPGINPVQDVAGNDAASFSGISVTNNTPPSGGGTSTFTPTADAHVKSTSPTTNYGALTTMQLREEASPGVTYRDYLKFNVTGLGGTVSAVKLRLFITDVSPDSGTVYSVSDASWSEGSITWNTAPAFGATALGSAGATTTAGTWVEITLSPSAVTGNGVVSFGLKTTSTNSSIFSSKEGTNPPELLVTTSAVADSTPPSPTTSTVNGTSLVINFDEALANTAVPTGQFAVQGSTSGAHTTNNVGIAGSAITLTLATPVVNGETVTVTYTKPGSAPWIQDAAGNPTATFNALGSTNNTPPSGGTSTFTPTDDTQVKSTSPTTNYGTLATMQLREEVAPGVTYHDYLKFNVTGLSGTVTAVKLRLFITDVSPDSGSVYPVSDTTWIETGINWNTAPAIGATVVGSAGATTTAGTWVEITLSPSAVSGNGLVSFALKTTSTNSSIFDSSEGTNPPQLVVTTS